MSTTADGSPQPAKPELPTDPAALQAALDERRAHLTATVEELTNRLDPSRVVQEAQQQAGERVRDLIRDEQGGLRVERVAAVAAAAAVLVLVVAVGSARSRSRREYRRAEKRAVDEAVRAAATQARREFRARRKAASRTEAG